MEGFTNKKINTEDQNLKNVFGTDNLVTNNKLNVYTTTSRGIGEFICTVDSINNGEVKMFDIGSDHDLYTNIYISGHLTVPNISGSAPAPGLQNLYIQISNDKINWYWISNITFVTLINNGQSTNTHFFNDYIKYPLRYFRIFNNNNNLLSSINAN